MQVCLPPKNKSHGDSEQPPEPGQDPAARQTVCLSLAAEGSLRAPEPRQGPPPTRVSPAERLNPRRTSGPLASWNGHRTAANQPPLQKLARHQALGSPEENTKLSSLP